MMLMNVILFMPMSPHGILGISASAEIERLFESGFADVA
jgi:hypothetical protein